MKRKTLIIRSIILIILVLFGLTSCKTDKKSIVFGASRPLTGPLSIFEQTAFGPIYKMWIDEVNADGGIYLKKYKKKLPIETVIYDDESDIDKMSKNIEKLIVEDKVDFLLPPASTTFLFAAAPIANKYGYLLLGAEGGASKLKEIISGLPYFYSLLNFSDHNQIPVFADVMAKTGAKTAAVVFISDIHGIEYSSVAITELTLKGINISMVRSIPLGVKNMAPIIKEAKSLNVDAFLCMGYPDETILATQQSIEFGFNPKVFLLGPGGNFEFFKDMFGPSANGIISWGAWNEKSSPEHKEFANKLANRYGRKTIDWWGHNAYYAGLQFYQQAIEKAGDVDNKKVQEIFAEQSFDTILGPTHFDKNHLLAVECYAGQVGQWQNGIFEVIGPSDKVTAKIIYPKPKWPN